MHEHTGEPPQEYTEYTVTREPIMVVNRIAQALISQSLYAALDQLDVVANAIREDAGGANASLIYLSAVNARAHVDEALKQLPWGPLPGDRRRAVNPPPSSG